MTAKAPPVPQENRSGKGTGDAVSAREGGDEIHKSAAANPDKQGQQGNSKQNTTHQGYQQDR